MLTFVTGPAKTTELVSLVFESRLDLVELHVTPSVRTFASGEAVDFMGASVTRLLRAAA